MNSIATGALLLAFLAAIAAGCRSAGIRDGAHSSSREAEAQKARSRPEEAGTAERGEQNSARRSSPFWPFSGLLFPLNVAPDMLSNTIVYLFNAQFSEARGEPPSNLWPVISMLALCMGPISGLLDAAAGYPFWDPIGLEHDRKYPWDP